LIGGTAYIPKKIVSIDSSQSNLMIAELLRWPIGGTAGTATTDDTDDLFGGSLLSSRDITLGCAKIGTSLTGFGELAEDSPSKKAGGLC
jgi:hypothetical protein